MFKRCETCGATIGSDELIYWSTKDASGIPLKGTKEQLYARVCRHAKGRIDNQCINNWTTYNRAADFAFAEGGSE